MIGKTKDLLQKGMGIDTSNELADDLRFMQPVNYVPLQFMKKELIRKQLAKVRQDGRTSTDNLDALAMTSYMPVTTPEAEEARLQYKRREPRRSGNATYMGA